MPRQEFTEEVFKECTAKLLKLQESIKESISSLDDEERLQESIKEVKKSMEFIYETVNGLK